MPDWTTINKLAQRDVNGEKLDPIEIALLKLYRIDDPEYEVTAAEGATEYAEMGESIRYIRENTAKINNGVVAILSQIHSNK